MSASLRAGNSSDGYLQIDGADIVDITASGMAPSSGKTITSNALTTAAITGLTADSSPDATADYVMTYDASAAAMKKVLLSNVSPVAKQITDSTDISLVDITSSYSTVGSSFSMSIPTAGTIELTAATFRLLTNTYTSGSAGVNFGIRIGATNYWFSERNVNGTPTYQTQFGGANTAGQYVEFKSAGVSSTNGASCMQIGIAASGVPTGTQTVQLIFAGTVGSGSTFTAQIKGTTTTTRVFIIARSAV